MRGTRNTFRSKVGTRDHGGFGDMAGEEGSSGVSISSAG